MMRMYDVLVLEYLVPTSGPVVYPQEYGLRWPSGHGQVVGTAGQSGRDP